MADKRYDEVYDIHMAHFDEIPIIMDFMGKEWKAGHILSYNRAFFEYQYCNGENVNMILAFRKGTGELEGFLGFIPANNESPQDTWGSMWKIRNNNMLFLGTELMQRLLEHLHCRTYIGVGINMTTTGKIVGKRFNWIIGRMKQWYILNQHINYKIAVIKNNAPCVPHQPDIKEYKIEKATNFDALASVFNFENYKSMRPYKDGIYIKNRYFDHPFFHYDVFAVLDSKSQASAFFVMREIYLEGAKVIRLVDFVGNKELIKYIGIWLKNYLGIQKAEYIDFYEYGFSDECLKEAGFTERMLEDENIIPNYFSPFVQKNIEIYFHAPDHDVTICKADADQDRPN